VIAFGMVVPAVIGIWLDRLLGTVVLFAILGTILGMALGFWQLLKIAKEPGTECSAVPGQSGVDKSLDTRDNGAD
jgi:F0F1-type ATP synthase assembly protein I